MSDDHGKIRLNLSLVGLGHLAGDDVLVTLISCYREDGRAEGRREALLEAASAAHQFQDIVGWQPGESRNRLVGDIEAAIRKLIEAEKGGGG